MSGARSEMAPDKLLARVEAHLKRTGEKATAFGFRVTNDPNLVRRLRNGRNCRFDLEQRILAAMKREDSE